MHCYGYYLLSLPNKQFNKCPAPGYVIELLGTHFIISGAVFGEEVYVDHLVPPLWLVWQPNNSAAMIHVAKTMKSLRQSLVCLEQYYHDIETGKFTVKQPRFPSFSQSSIEYV